MTLAEWKAHFLVTWEGTSDEKRNQETRCAIRDARSWREVVAAVPEEWKSAARAKCRREEIK